MKGESVLWTRLSRFLAAHPLNSSFISPIRTLITFISCSHLAVDSATVILVFLPFVSPSCSWRCSCWSSCRDSASPLSLVLFIAPFSLALQELLVEDLVLPSKFLKVGGEISHLLLHRSYLWRLATGGEQLRIDFHRLRPDDAVLLYRCGERQRCAFPTDGAN